MRKYLKSLLGLDKQKVTPSKADMRTQQQEAERLLEQEEAKRLLEQEGAKRLLEQEALVLRTSSYSVGLVHGGFVNRNPKQETHNSSAFIPPVEPVEEESISSLANNTTNTSMAR